MNLQAEQTKSNHAKAANATSVLLDALIDYAGLFPPASLGMTGAVENYGNYSRSEYSWILGRFICPVARLGEFEKALGALFGDTGRQHNAAGFRGELSVLPGADISFDLDRVQEFNARFAASPLPVDVEIKSVELKVASPEEIARISNIMPEGLETYVEIPASGHQRELIAAVADCGLRAKIRTGGETADKFPVPEDVVEFIRLCAAAGVPFKATAGLHHPLRSMHRFTYQLDSPSGIMHGFLNVFLTAAFLKAGMEPALAKQVLVEQSAGAFHFDSNEIVWRDHKLNVRDIAAARQGFSVSFGSCSFTEPIDDLRTLHLL